LISPPHEKAVAIVDFEGSQHLLRFKKKLQPRPPRLPSPTSLEQPSSAPT
jgi:hypothetical protein